MLLLYPHSRICTKFTTVHSFSSFLPNVIKLGYYKSNNYYKYMRDKQIEKLIKDEEKRQKSVVNLIASENIVSDDVLLALGSKLTNKYAEGYPGRRYYGGNQVVDK